MVDKSGSNNIRENNLYAFISLVRRCMLLLLYYSGIDFDTSN